MKVKILDIARRSLALTLTVLFVFTMTPQLARGQDYPDTYDEDIDQIVARVSFVQGPVSYARGDDPDEWDAAVVNIPFALGDRLYSAADGRAELALPGGSFVRIGRGSYVSALTLTYDTKQFYVGNGAATFTVRRLGNDEIFEIDTPSVAVTVDQPGRYRVEVDENGDTRVIVRGGVAYVAANGRQLTVERAEMDIYGLDAAEYEIVGLRQLDSFDRWVDERQARFDARFQTAYRYADEGIAGVDELADYGRWEQIPDYGYAWTPTRVAVGWQPFTVGHWFWQDPWGWTWISEEPWGWAPCHYGRWTFYRERWYWVPVRGRVEVVRYAPAIVGFVSVGGNIGWFPLHPRDRFVPWWGRRERIVENVTFVNRTRVVLVNEQTFISSRRVTTNIIRDQTIIREATTVRISDRRLPVPQRESIHVTAERRQVQRPSATIISRQVVVRNAPTPPPPRFDEKVRVIRERQGQPLTTREIVDMGTKDFKSNRRIQIRTAGETKGNFTARGGQASQAAKPQALAPLKGRNLATPDNPVSTEGPRRQQREPQKDERQIQQQQQKDQKQQERDLQKQQQEQKKQERDQDLQQKKQERDQLRDQKQLQEQQKKDQDLQRKDLERKQQDQDRLQKKQERDQDLQQKKQERDQDQLLKKQERDQIKDQKQLQDQQRKQQDQDQLQKKQERDIKEQEKKGPQLERKDQQQQDRKQLQDDQQKQRQLQQDQQRQQQQQQKDQKQQDQDQRRQELERQRLEKQQQDKQGRDLGRERQQQPREDQLQQKKPQEQLREKKPDEQQRKGPPADDRTQPRKERKDQDAAPPPPPPPGPPPGGPPPR